MRRAEQGRATLEVEVRDVRCITWTLFAGLLVMAVPEVSLAQHGGGHVGGAIASSGHGSVTPHYGGATQGFRAPAFPGYTGISHAPTFSGYTGIWPGALNTRGGYGSRGGYGNRGGYGYRGRDFRHVPYGYFFAPYYYPFLDYADSAYPDYGPGFDAAADPNQQEGLMAENMLGDQVNRLSAEVEQLKYGQAPQAPAFQTREDPPPPQPPVMLVLRSGQQLKVQNYAVMDQTFWDFSSQPARKIPIANIDVAASAKATAAGGGEFPQLDGDAHGGR